MYVSYNLHIQMSVISTISTVFLFSRVENNDTELTCAIIEVLYHPNLVVLDIGYMSNYWVDMVDFGLFLPGMICSGFSADTYCVCEQFNNLCSHFIGDTPCNLLPYFTRADRIDRTCRNEIKVQLYAPRLEEFRAQNVAGVAAKTNNANQTICYVENKVKILDYSFINIAQLSKENPAESPNYVTVRGWENVEELYYHDGDAGYYLQNPHMLYGLPKLRILDVRRSVSGWYISNDTENVIFSQSFLLEQLYLGHTQLVSVPYGEFTALFRLQILDLSENSLKSISFDISNLTELVFLNLSHNILTQLPQQMRTDLDLIVQLHDVSIHIEGNKLDCRCSGLDFLQWVRHTSVTFLEKQNTLCAASSGNMDTSIDTLTEEMISNLCKSYSWVAAPVLLVGAVVIISLLILRRRGIICRKLEFRDGDALIDFESDAFVIYADEDRNWVHGILLNYMENIMEHKLCVHFRDFTPGHNIEEQILNAIKRSFQVNWP